MVPARALRVLFCGEPEFGAGFRAVRGALEAAGRLAHGGAGEGVAGVELARCKRGALRDWLPWADVAVPLMAQLDAPLLGHWARAPAEYSAGAPYPRAIFQFGVGLEGVDVEAANREGIWVANIPSSAMELSPNAASCSEMAILLALACLRRWNAMQSAMQSRESGLPMGEALLGKRCLVVGFGDIAQELIVRLQAFGAVVSAVRRRSWDQGDEGRLTQRARDALESRGTGRDELLAMSREADVVFLTCVQTESTRGMIDAEFLDRCKDGITLVNVARGGLLDYAAVRAGLRTGKLGALGLDVQWSEPFDPDDEIAKHPNVILTPHVAGVTKISYDSMGSFMARQLIHLQASGTPPSTTINLPLGGDRSVSPLGRK